MAKISDSDIVSRDIVCLGEIKMEFIKLNPSGSIANGDHLASNLQNPEDAVVSAFNNLGLQAAAKVDSSLEDGRGVALYGVGASNASVVIIGY